MKVLYVVLVGDDELAMINSKEPFVGNYTAANLMMERYKEKYPDDPIKVMKLVDI